MVIRRGTIAVVANSKVFGAMEISNKAFEVGVMELGGAGRKLGKSGNGISDIQTAGDIAVHQFTEKGAKREVSFVFKFAVFRRAFCGTTSTITKERFVHFVYAVFREGRRRSVTRFSNGKIIFPFMGSNDAVNVVGA